ncbi:hypothetical protein MBLNU457_4514t2 [Dothideomycetes sp. NU457]
MNMQELQRHLGISQKGHQVKPTDSTTQLPLETVNPSDLVFISIDLEAFEHAHHKITEIGLSAFDTRSLTSSSGGLIAPGPNASNWLPFMKHRHIRIKEHLKHVNKRFIKGCPEKFDYGTSDIQTLNDVPSIVQRVLQTGNLHPLPYSTEQRDIVLLSHGLSNDIKFLTSIDIPPTSPVVVNAKKADTQRLCSTKKNLRSLKKYLDALGIEHKNLHNAGNDAALTLQALLTMAVVERETPGTVQSRIAEPPGVLAPTTEKQEQLRLEKVERRRKAREERGKLKREHAGQEWGVPEPPKQKAEVVIKPVSASEIERKREREEEDEDEQRMKIRAKQAEQNWGWDLAPEQSEQEAGTIGKPLSASEIERNREREKEDEDEERKRIRAKYAEEYESFKEADGGKRSKVLRRSEDDAHFSTYFDTSDATIGCKVLRRSGEGLPFSVVYDTELSRGEGGAADEEKAEQDQKDESKDVFTKADAKMDIKVLRRSGNGAPFTFTTVYR